MIAESILKACVGTKEAVVSMRNTASEFFLDIIANESTISVDGLAAQLREQSDIIRLEYTAQLAAEGPTVRPDSTQWSSR